jgi:hypothetical protein
VEETTGEIAAADETTWEQVVPDLAGEEAERVIADDVHVSDDVTVSDGVEQASDEGAEADLPGEVLTAQAEPDVVDEMSSAAEAEFEDFAADEETEGAEGIALEVRDWDAGASDQALAPDALETVLLTLDGLSLPPHLSLDLLNEAFKNGYEPALNGRHDDLDDTLRRLEEELAAPDRTASVAEPAAIADE